MGKTEDIELQENLLSSYEEDEAAPPPSPPPKNLPPSSSHETIYKGTTLKIFPKQWRHSLVVKFQILLSFYMLTIVGIADQTVGTLMPTLIKHYDTSQTVVTILFILQFAGYSSSALSNGKLHTMFGRRGVINGGILCLSLSFLVNSTEPKLWIYIVAHYLYGLGIGLIDSCMNVLLSSLEDSNELMGFMHGCYGLGSMIGPPMVSLILDSGHGFGLHYLILFVLGSVGVCSGIWLFKHDTTLKYEYEMSISDDDNDEDGDKDDEEYKEFGFMDLIRDKLVLSFSLYVFLYVGTEISFGSWFLSYLVHIKNLKELEASYIVSWFWIGLTIGRMLLGFVTKKFKNEYRANLYYSFISLISFTVYSIFTSAATNDFSNMSGLVKVTNIILVVNAGVFIGPLFPTANVCLMKIIPSKLHVTAVGIITSIGGTGSAILPFTVGVLVELTSFSFLPFYVTLIIAGYCFLWLNIPKKAGSSVKYDF
jgi:fucose permease